ncbi:MAG: hypothetical protein AVDCRST_MAG68-5236, partial [uncultured Gemmatimonadetes bacterium]
DPLPLLRRDRLQRGKGAPLQPVDRAGRGARRAPARALAAAPPLPRGPALVRGRRLAQDGGRGRRRARAVGRRLPLWPAQRRGGAAGRRAARVVVRRGRVGRGPPGGRGARDLPRPGQGPPRHRHQRCHGPLRPAPLQADGGGAALAPRAARRGRGVHHPAGAGGRAHHAAGGVSVPRRKGPGDQGLARPLAPRRGTCAPGGPAHLLLLRAPLAGGHRLHPRRRARRLHRRPRRLAVPRRPGPALPRLPRPRRDGAPGGLDLSPPRRFV